MSLKITCESEHFFQDTKYGKISHNVLDTVEA